MTTVIDGKEKQRNIFTNIIVVSFKAFFSCLNFNHVIFTDGDGEICCWILKQSQKIARPRQKKTRKLKTKTKTVNYGK